MSDVKRNQITTTRADVIWNYIGTVVSMASGFVLLPLLMKYLSADELGLWYVFVALANLATLFEFGFHPTFSRNIVYVMSGARRLSGQGFDSSSIRDGVDWHLLNVLVSSSKIVYGVISVVITALLALFGSIYISLICDGLPIAIVWVSWAIFCISICINIYFLSSVTLLRGYGDIAGENKSKTLAKLSQLAVSALLLVCGWGLIGASLGYLVNDIMFRLVASFETKQHAWEQESRKADIRTVTREEVFDALRSVTHVSWRDGLVQIANYLSTQATSLVASVCLGLSETGSYSILLQLGGAVYNFASVYPRSYFPMFQAAFAKGDIKRQRRCVSAGIFSHAVLFLVGITGVVVCVFPVLRVIQPGYEFDVALFLVIGIYYFMWNQQALFCNYIISMNEIPYVRAYCLAAIVGTSMSFVFAGCFGCGAFGIIFGQIFAQLQFNAIRWPRYLLSKLDMKYLECLRDGLTAFKNRFDCHGSV